MSRAKARIAALLVSTLLAGATAEIAARVIHPTAPTKLAAEREDPDTEKRLAPGFTNVRPAYGVSVHVNADGFRDDEDFPVEKPSNERRILFVGDSFVYAERLPLAKTFMKLVEKPGTRSISLCCPGWGTRHERAALEKWGLATKPDVVVLCFFVGNDVLETYSTELAVVVDPDHSLRFEKREMSLRKRVLLQSRLYQLWATWRFKKQEDGLNLRPDQSYYKIQRLRFEQWRRGAWEKPPLKEAWELVARELERFVALACQHARVVLLVIPDEMQANPDERAELCRREGLDEKDYDLEQPQRALREIAARLSLPVVDALPAMKGRTDLYFAKDTHWNEKGHALAASLLAPALEEPR